MPRFSLGLLSLTGALLLCAPSASGQFTDLGLLPGDLTIQAAADAQEQPDVAAGSGGFLVAWTDQRTDSSLFGSEQTGRDVLAARLDSAGNLLDTTPIVVHQTYGTQERPRVVWNGTHWLVVWRSQEPNATFYSDGFRAARVAPDGTVLDSPPILVHQYPYSSSSSFSVASDGDGWLMVVEGTSAGENGILGVRIAADGSVLDDPPVTLVPAAYYLHFNIVVESAGGEYLLAYDTVSARRLLRLASDLTPIGTSSTTKATWMLGNGAGYYAVWSAGGALRGSPMALDGTLARPTGAVIGTPSSFNGLDIAWDGTRWWVSWKHLANGLTVARVQADGTVLDVGGVVLDPGNDDFQFEHATAGAAGGGLAVTWKDSRAGGLNPYDIRAVSVASDLDVGPQAVLSLGTAHQQVPDIAAGGPGALVVFLRRVSGSDRILAQRLDHAGAALDAEPLQIAEGVGLAAPKVDWNGQHFMVVWGGGGDVLARRVLPDGTLPDPAPITVMVGLGPDVAALGDDFLVIATQIGFSIHYIFPMAARVDGPTGTVLDDPPIPLGQSFAQVPRVLAFGGRWVALWQRNYSHDDPASSVEAALVEPDGSTGGSFVVGYGGTPDMAASGDGATLLFVWRTGTSSSSNPDIAARRMLADGTLLDGSFGLTLESAPDMQLRPVAGWNGSAFQVAWEDKREAEHFFDERTDLYGVCVGTDGAITVPAGPLAVSSLPLTRPRLGEVGGALLMVSSDYHAEAPHAAYRIALRAFDPEPAWTDIGFSLAGTRGDPALAGSGPLTAGSPVSVALSNALELAPAFLFLGLTELNHAPFYGGTLVPDFTVPPGQIIIVFTDAVGAAWLGTTWPAGIPAGFELCLQAWIADAGGPFGFAASNAVRAVAP